MEGVENSLAGVGPQAHSPALSSLPSTTCGPATSRPNGCTRQKQALAPRQTWSPPKRTLNTHKKEFLTHYNTKDSSKHDSKGNKADIKDKHSLIYRKAIRVSADQREADKAETGKWI